MASKNYDKCLETILHHEGGYVNHPKDPGGEPMTLKAVDEYVERNGLENTIKRYQGGRQAYYESLSTFATFGRGWTRRVQETTELALSLI
jgi:lysozyme family protein